MKGANYEGLNKVECAEKEEALDTNHTELCGIYHHAIRMSVKDSDEAIRKHFFISKDLEGVFNQGTLMKTCHTEKHSWSIVRSKTTEFRLNMSTPKALQAIMDKNTTGSQTEVHRDHGQTPQPRALVRR